MIKKWEVVPAPSEKNQGRHKLLIKGDTKDILQIVKKLGGLCSRPEKTTGEFNFVIYLSRLEKDTLKKLKSVAGEQSSPAADAGSFGEEPPLFDIPRPRLKLEPAPAPQSAPAPVIPQTASQGANVPSISARRKKSAAPETAAERPAALAPAHQASISARAKTKWSMELPLIPTYSFQTLISGSHNRFAHAAAMAVVENPGVIYNPLLLFGAPGTGKTHFINAISYGLSASIGQNNIFVTDGIKLSRGIEIVCKEGGMARLEEIFAKVKVLIIDDVHLLAVSETNKKYISKWLNDFVAQNKQIVVTSVFPPKSLAGLEEAAGFQFSQGWMVDLKMPGAQAYKSIMTQILQGLDVKLSEDEITSIFASGTMSFGDAERTLGDMKKLEKFLVSSRNSLSHLQLLDTLIGFGETPVPGALSDQDVQQASAWTPSQKDTWFKWGIFYPRGMKREADFALYSLHERARELGLNTEWSQVFAEEYNSDELYGVPFRVGNYASERNVNGVIVLGPQPTSSLGAQEAEFRHIVFKILDSFLIKGAWLPQGKFKSKAAYAKILMDLV
ncbi:MAG TPA: hypothetical protein DCS63_09530 [Elusimicrobia bacterium]|nr:hypothetical protein [Elusimicrobiota bacterium]